MYPKLISCRAVIDQMRPFLPEDMATEVLEVSWHARPEQLQKRVQEAIDASDGLFDPIYLGYGMCAKAVIGLIARKSRLVVPKSDDCIEIFLGSRKARQEELAKEPGTYFLTQGYSHAGASAVCAEYEHSAAKYGREKAEKLLQLMMAHYKRLVYIRMPGASDLEADREYARSMAARFQMRHVEIEGTADWLKRMIQQEWDDQFVVVEPGQPIEHRHFMAF